MGLVLFAGNRHMIDACLSKESTLTGRYSCMVSSRRDEFTDRRVPRYFDPRKYGFRAAHKSSGRTTLMGSPSRVWKKLQSLVWSLALMNVLGMMRRWAGQKFLSPGAEEPRDVEAGDARVPERCSRNGDNLFHGLFAEVELEDAGKKTAVMSPVRRKRQRRRATGSFWCP